MKAVIPDLTYRQALFIRNLYNRLESRWSLPRTPIRGGNDKLSFPISRFVVSGHSMLPTLKPGQSVITLNWFFKLKDGDIVVFKMGNKYLVKRLHKHNDRMIYVNGDNNKDSLDVGVIDKSQIIGKVIYLF